MNMKKILFVGAIVAALGIGTMIGPLVGLAETNTAPFQPPFKAGFKAPFQNGSADSTWHPRGFGRGGYFAGSMHAIIAETLGLTTDELNSLIASGKTLEEIAKDKGLTADQLLDALIKAKTEELDKLVKDGKITEEQKAAYLANMENGMKLAITNANGFGWKQRGFGVGGNFAGSMHGIIAETLGLTADELSSLRASGKSLEEIAKEKGFTTDQLIDVLVKAHTEQLEQLVKDGKITEEQKTAFLANMETNIKNAITNGNFGFGKGFRGHGKGPRFNDPNFQPGQGNFGKGAGPRWQQNNNTQ